MTSHETNSSSASSAPLALGKGTRLLGEYEIGGVLGQGGMGQVYLVRSHSTGQQFAVKKALQRDEANRRNFLAELQTLVNLPEHPHLAACRFFRTVGDEIVLFF